VPDNASIHVARAGGRGRAHHSVELSTDDGRVEARPALAAGCTVILKPPSRRRSPRSNRQAGTENIPELPPGIFNVSPATPWRGARSSNPPWWTRSRSRRRDTGKRSCAASAARTSRRYRSNWAVNRPTFSSPMLTLTPRPTGAVRRVHQPGEVCSAVPAAGAAGHFQEVHGSMKEKTNASSLATAQARDEDGPLVSEEHLKKVTSYIGSQERGEVLAGGDRPKVSRKGITSSPRSLRLTIHPHRAEEVFVPSSPASHSRTKLTRSRSPRYALRPRRRVWSRDIFKCLRVVKNLRAASSGSIHATVLRRIPWGAIKQRQGRELPPRIDEFLETKQCISISTKHRLAGIE